ncbi:ABC transporter ATP-binding protein [Salipaludibacillus daqingensis]|uniref:ABC transporter ATP-binding protein n=1 Tax=Salipaludibacillus daqingensis TaxID=3041001 RepID=UPI002476BB85|nr:ABC transporter ATP-binding protein [Salipaludibacillus daqingensis]
MSAITLSNVSKEYTDGLVNRTVIKNLSIEVSSNQFITIHGPSGNGKSTLLKMISGLIQPTSGTCVILGANPYKGQKGVKWRAKNIGYIFQNHYLLPELTALENVLYMGALAGWKKKIILPRAKQIFDYLSISKQHNSLPETLSGGERQRVAIARAIINDPPILLADEPTASLDRDRADELFDLLLEMSKKQGKTVVMVTHDERYRNKGDASYLLSGQILEKY